MARAQSDIGELLSRYAGAVDARLDALLPSDGDEPGPLSLAMRYACLAPGKRLRPALCLASATAVRGDWAAALDAACSVELVHCFSLIHDDLPAIDNDELRRGRPTCHVQFGEAMAILAGDALFALAFSVLCGRDDDPRRVRCIRMLTQASGPAGLVGGEASDILAEGREVGLAEIESIHRRKTASLMSASCQIGGVWGGGTDEEVLALGTFGTSLGLAFQIADDILNEVSTPDQLGKAAGSDRERRKATYPSVLGLEGARRAAFALESSAREELQHLSGDTSFLAEMARFAVTRVR